MKRIILVLGLIFSYYTSFTQIITTEYIGLTDENYEITSEYIDNNVFTFYGTFISWKGSDGKITIFVIESSKRANLETNKYRFSCNTDGKEIRFIVDFDSKTIYTSNKLCFSRTPKLTK